MPPISITFEPGPLALAQKFASRWTGESPGSPAAVWLSAGTLSQVERFTYPQHLKASCPPGVGPSPMRSYFHVGNGPDLLLPGGGKPIPFYGCEPIMTEPFKALLWKFRVPADRRNESQIAIITLHNPETSRTPRRSQRLSNERFTDLALAEGFRPHCVMTVMDCYSPSDHEPAGMCEADITGRRVTNLQRLRPQWLVTDHFNGPWPGQQPPCPPTVFAARVVGGAKQLSLRASAVLGHQTWPDGRQGVRPAPHWEDGGQGPLRRDIVLYEVC